MNTTQPDASQPVRHPGHSTGRSLSGLAMVSPIATIPKNLIPPPYTLRHGACWGPGCDPDTDLPCGFTDYGSMLTYFELGSPGAAAWDYNFLYAMPWVSKLTALVASGGFTPSTSHHLFINFAMLYFSVTSAAHAWYSLYQLAPTESTTAVGPLVTPKQCASLGLTYVAINPIGTPWPAAPLYTWAATVFNPTVWGLTEL